MNEKITFPRLATLLADTSGRSKRFSEDFLREFFSLISETLEGGESVKIKGLGTFRLSRVEPRKSVDVTTGQPMEISGHTKVVFIPAKELAEAVNAPFEAFTAIEISDDTDISQLFPQDDIELQDSQDNDSTEAEATEESFPAATATTLYEEAASTEEQPDDQAAPEVPEETENSEETEPAEESEKAEKSVEPEDSNDSQEEASEEGANEGEPGYEEIDPNNIRRKKWKKILPVSLGAALFALIATIAVWYLAATDDFNRHFDQYFNRTAANTQTQSSNGHSEGKEIRNTENATLDNIITEDTAAETGSGAPEETEVPTAPSDAVVYDTVSTTRYLTTIAKAHYGNYNLWPYIYEENKAILGHPDRIRPGTPVVVPKLSKYGVDPLRKEDVEKAKKMGVEIYARYGKKI